MMKIRCPFWVRRQVCGLAVVLVVVVGCTTGEQDDLPREAVSGVVTLDGKPLPAGLIRFAPQPPGPTEGGTLVRDGAFSIDRANGLVPGHYVVSIQANEKSGEPRKEGQRVETGGGRVGRPLKELIPARYNAKSELKVDIKSGGSNDGMKFELSSK